MPVDFKDYYKVLDVERIADEATIKKAYRAMARKLHPDVNKDDPTAEERFKDLNEAYEVLSDPEKRKMYDRFGTDWQAYRDAGYSADTPRGSAGGGGTTGSRTRTQPDDFETWFRTQANPSGGSTFSYEWVDGTDPSAGGSGRFSDFFNMIFGNQQAGGQRTTSGSRVRPPMAQRGEDIDVNVDVTLREAATGTARHVALQIPGPCPRCGGTGVARGGMCPTCDGTGVSMTQKTLEVTIPKGVRTGSRVRMAGQGGPGVSGGPNGDVFLVIHVADDPTFTREGNNLRERVTIPFYTAVLGGEATIPTLTGKVAMTIPAGTEDGKVFRLRGKGMPALNSKTGETGDLLAEVHVAVPTNLSDEERELFTKLKNLRQ